MKHYTLFIVILVISSNVLADTSDTVQNLVSTTHIIGEANSLTQIHFSWDEPLSTQWENCSYFILFDQNSNEEFAFSNDNISGSPVTGNIITFPCEGDNDAYYFHIVPAKFGFSPPGYILGDTRNWGPFFIDTTPPFNQTLYTPAYTASEMINITTVATGATEMCISNFTFGDCSLPWPEYTPFHQWQLIPNDGLKTIFVRFKDGAGNTSDALATTELISEALTVSFAVRSGSRQENSYTLEITFNRSVTGFEIDDIQTVNCKLSNFKSYGIFPYSSFSVDILLTSTTEYWIKIPENVAFDIAGNGNLEAMHHFIYSVPTLTEWGRILLFCILLLMGTICVKNRTFHFIRQRTD
ncbi:MAG: hypothetical protein HQK75_11570 [Candidatus Magnetomorum sp.]|nr:hypothetical protein [Candidatus Magnetomorum sp.]